MRQNEVLANAQRTAAETEEVKVVLSSYIYIYIYINVLLLKPER
jgi:hypothetical protein